MLLSIAALGLLLTSSANADGGQLDFDAISKILQEAIAGAQQIQNPTSGTSSTFKTAVVTYHYVDRISEGDHTLYFDGKNVALDLNVICQPPAQGEFRGVKCKPPTETIDKPWPEHRTILFQLSDPKITTLDYNSKTATTGQLSAPHNRDAADTLGGGDFSDFGKKIVGKNTVLGKECTVYESPSSRECIYQGIFLQGEGQILICPNLKLSDLSKTNSADPKSPCYGTKIATQIQFDVDVPKDKFIIPENFQKISAPAPKH
jgi:hypothetical protein